MKSKLSIIKIFKVSLAVLILAIMILLTIGFMLLPAYLGFTVSPLFFIIYVPLGIYIYLTK